MSAVFTCLAYEHDLRLVALAALLCFLSTSVAMQLLKRAENNARSARVIWLFSAGGAGGFGIWTTHFVAMLAYDPGVVFGYEANQTFLSLAIAIATTTAAAFCSTSFSGRSGYLSAGLLFGVGVSCMHFTGMTAVEFPGTIHWNRTLVLASIAMAVAFSVPAFSLRLHGKKRSPVLLPALLLSLAIVLMHFTAMGAVTIVEYVGTASTNLLSPMLMVIVITTVALSLLFTGLATALFAIKAENVASAGEANFRLLVQGVTDYAIYMLDPEGRVTNWNPGAQRFKGYVADEIVGKHFSRFYSEQDRRDGLPAKALEIARTVGKFEAEGYRFRKDGTSFWASVVIDPIRDDTGTLVGYAKITRDCTEQMLAARQLKQALDNLSLALDNMANGICLFDGDARLVLHNRRFLEIMGLPTNAAIVGHTFEDFAELSQKPDADCQLDPASTGTDHVRLPQPVGVESVRTIKSGKTLRIINLPAGDGSWVTTIEDITERVKSEAQIAHLARHDTLTGLPNRRQFLETLDAALAHSDASGSTVAVIGVDLDNFKEVNDTLGHAAGDTVLVALAQRMRETLVAGESVGRLGGDEFVAVKTYTDQNELPEFITRLNNLLTQKIDLSPTDVIPGASLGVAIYPQDATDREKLLSNADMAMYRSKGSIDQKISYYEAAMDEAARDRRAMARDIWIALEQKQFFLAYQEQYSIKSEGLTGYEVLIRWRHPDRGLVSPVDFIPIAEECGAICAIGDWVLEQACREAVERSLKHKIAVNLSPLQLNNVILIEKVRDILLATGLPASQLELEVTESAIIGDKVRALHILRQLKAMGVTIAIDDFGTGYSSLETLRSFPFDKIKLDRSFVNELDSRQSKAFVRAILALGKSLDVAILAEGVETRDQFHFLLDEGCDEVQGFLFGRPSTLEQLAARGPLLQSYRKVG